MIPAPDQQFEALREALGGYAAAERVFLNGKYKSVKEWRNCEFVMNLRASDVRRLIDRPDGSTTDALRWARAALAAHDQAKESGR